MGINQQNQWYVFKTKTELAVPRCSKYGAAQM
jgi:hypothetical protein